MRLAPRALRTTALFPVYLLGIATVLYAFSNALSIQAATTGPLFPPCLRQPCFPNYPQSLGPEHGVSFPVSWAGFVEHLLSFAWGPVGSAGGAVAGFSATTPATAVVLYSLGPTAQLVLLAGMIVAGVLLLPVLFGRHWGVVPHRKFGHQGLAMLDGVFLPFAAILLLMGIGLVTGGLETGCFAGVASYDLWYGTWTPPICAGGSPLPMWILPNHWASNPTHVPALDAALHGWWGGVAQSLLRTLPAAGLVALAAIPVAVRKFRAALPIGGTLDGYQAALSIGLSPAQAARWSTRRRAVLAVIGAEIAAIPWMFGACAVVGVVFGIWPVPTLIASASLWSGVYPYPADLVFGGLFTLGIVTYASRATLQLLSDYLRRGSSTAPGVTA